MSARVRVGRTENKKREMRNKRGIERDPSTSTGAGLYTKIVPTKDPSW